MDGSRGGAGYLDRSTTVVPLDVVRRYPVVLPARAERPPAANGHALPCIDTWPVVVAGGSRSRSAGTCSRFGAPEARSIGHGLEARAADDRTFHERRGGCPSA